MCYLLPLSLFISSFEGEMVQRKEGVGCISMTLHPRNWLLGIGVAVVVHQPRDEIWRLFDSVLVLCANGKTAYCGPRDQALAYFQSLGYARPKYRMYMPAARDKLQEVAA